MSATSHASNDCAQCLCENGDAADGQQTREEATEARKAAGVHAVPICEFEMETQKGEKFTRDDLKGSFSLLMFGDSVSNHAMQGLAKLQEIVVEQGTYQVDNNWPVQLLPSSVVASKSSCSGSALACEPGHIHTRDFFHMRCGVFMPNLKACGCVNSWHVLP